jgi:hypothetical protein
MKTNKEAMNKKIAEFGSNATDGEVNTNIDSDSVDKVNNNSNNSTNKTNSTTNNTNDNSNHYQSNNQVSITITKTDLPITSSIKVIRSNYLTIYQTNYLSNELTIYQTNYLSIQFSI